MAAELCFAFWNVSNLFAAGVVPRGPASAAEVDAKVERLAAVLAAIGTHGPDLLGLAEVGSEPLFHRLAQRVMGHRGQWWAAWSEPARADQCGLGLLARVDCFSRLRVLDEYRRTGLARPMALVAELTVSALEQPVLVVVNHWKSRLQRPGEVSGHQQRLEVAGWVSEQLHLAGRPGCAVVMGDFNAEPMEAPFATGRLEGSRFHTCRSPALYNAAWRYVGAPDPLDLVQAPRYRASRPRTTHDSSPPVLFDQLLVSTDALAGRPLRFVESRSGYHLDEDHDAVVRPSSGYVLPKRWRHGTTTGGSGASDHLPLVAVFEYGKRDV